MSSEKVIRQLQNNYGITDDLARWTVDTWAISLHIIDEMDNIQLNRKLETTLNFQQHYQTEDIRSFSPSQLKKDTIPDENGQNAMNDNPTNTGLYALGLLIISVILILSGDMLLGGFGVIALIASMMFTIYFLSITSFPRISTQPINRSSVSISRSQITGRYEQNKFVLLLAILFFVIPFMFPNAHIEAINPIDRTIAWLLPVWIGVSFFLLAVYGGYFFPIKKK